MALGDGPSRPGSTRVAAEGARDTFEAREIKFESQNGLLELEQYVKRMILNTPKLEKGDREEVNWQVCFRIAFLMTCRDVS